MFGFGTGSHSGTGLQAPVNWQQTTTPMSRIGGYIPPAEADYSLLGPVGTPGVATGMNLNSMGGGQGLVPTDSFWGNNSNSVLGKGDKGGAGTDIGWNTETLGLGVRSLAAIGGLYNAFQSNKLAKEQFNFTKEVTNTNLNNQIKTFNTTLEDRALARGRLNGEADPSAYAAAYTDKNRISRG